MSNNYLQFKSALEKFGCDVKADEPMKNHTSFKIGGSADLFVTVSDLNQLTDVISFCLEKNIPLFVLGNGSNLLVSDKGIRGLVLRLGGGFCDIGFNDDGTLHCGAGAQLSKLCAFALEHSLTGLEFAWGIPGSCGGAAFMDAGAYGGEMRNVVLSCEHVNLRTGERGVFAGEELDFDYRHSVYSGGGYVITALNLQLEKGDKEEIKAKMDDLMGRRKDKQPLEYPSAGSIFKRPVGYFAGGLIEQCGLKGAQVGGAQVSPKHAGFIVNVGGATCEDVLGLIEKIQKTVREETGVELECEVRKTGE
ncbi:MAG: UDP-N-acetylmuramate dehydrogenase [Clostridia bacterium]|nr:UDP-N-acetylmuramate dehydrogenase [Clostridia bacterium]